MTHPPSTESAAGIALEKARLRRLVAGRIAVLSPSQKEAAARRVNELLVALGDEVGREAALGYLALGDEVPVDGFLFDAATRGIPVLVPRCSRGELDFVRWTPGVRLGPDDERVLAPAGGEPERLPRGPVLVVVPGRAFDADGGRLGRGRGYYDRWLVTARPRGCLVAGVGYECQLVERLPRESHDAGLDVVVTEAGVRRCRVVR